MAEQNNFKNYTSLKKVKSKYILAQIFDNLKQIKKLEIIKYNKNIKKKLKTRINDYKKAYSTIEIENIPKEKEYGRFIYFPNKKGEFNYHIYFNGNREEILRTELNEDDKVNKIKVILNYKTKSLYELFMNCRCIKKIKFIKFNRNDIKNMGFMFYGCSSLEELDISNINTDSATNMGSMFYRCSSLKILNLSSFNTINVKDMSYMFNRCSSLEQINLSNFNTTKVLSMRHMFNGCSSLKELNISNFNTDNLVKMDSMFYNCSSLLELNLNNFNTHKVNDMRSLFN